MSYEELKIIASKIKENSYSPYSNFKVGAAILTESNKIYTGVNVENATFGATNCAERTAIFKAVTDGETKFIAIAIASDSCDYIYPCGICRQVLAEFADDNMDIICTNSYGEYKIHKLGELIPSVFRIIK